jgi:hypothetical protein
MQCQHWQKCTVQTQCRRAPCHRCTWWIQCTSPHGPALPTHVCSSSHGWPVAFSVGCTAGVANIPLACCANVPCNTPAGPLMEAWVVVNQGRQEGTSRQPPGHYIHNAPCSVAVTCTAQLAPRSNWCWQKHDAIHAPTANAGLQPPGGYCCSASTLSAAQASSPLHRDAVQASLTKSARPYAVLQHHPQQLLCSSLQTH